jgi:hypothetical protein
MITEKTILSGTEEELLAYFKEKYNLIETCNDSSVSPPENESSQANPDPHQGLGFPNKPAVVNQKATTGIGNLFGGTSWGN